MELTTEQLGTLKTYLAANHSALQDEEAAAAMNAVASPDFTVWKPSVSDAEIMQNGFNWTRVDNLSVGKARIWDWMFRFGTINPTNTNIRAGIDAVWVGTQADLDVRAAVYVHCKRLATFAEKLFAAGTGSDAVPATMTASGLLTAQNVGNARGLP